MAHKVAIINGKAPSGGSGGVSDADFSHPVINFFSKGIISSGSYLASQQSTPDMTVKVAIGKAYVPNPAGTMLYQSSLDSVGSVTVPSNSSGNPRIDAIVLKLDLGVSPNKDADNVATLVDVQGTPAASPSAPDDTAIQTAVGASNGFIRIANVTVANGASSIIDANITDTRVGAEFKLMSGRLKFNTSTSKLQFSHDGASYKDIGAGTCTPFFPYAGTVAVATSVSPLIIAPFALTILKAFARAKTGPTGADLIFDINKNGSTIWSTQANRLKIVDGASSGTQTSFNTTAVAEGDYLTLDIDQIGSTIPGADITVELYCTAA